MTTESLPKHANLFVSEVIAFTRLGKTKVYEMLARGEIPHVKIGDCYRIPRDEFTKWWDRFKNSGNFDSD